MVSDFICSLSIFLMISMVVCWFGGAQELREAVLDCNCFFASGSDFPQIRH